MKKHIHSSFTAQVRAAILVVSAALGLTASAQVTRTDVPDSSYIVSPDNPLWAWRDAVCSIYLGSSTTPYGNAFVAQIGDRYGVVTSRHNLEGSDGNGGGISSINLRFGPDLNAPSKVIHCSSFVLHDSPTGIPGDPNDIAIIYPDSLSSLSPVMAIPVSSGNGIGSGTHWYALGYGPSGSAGSTSTSLDGQLRWYENLISYTDGPNYLSLMDPSYGRIQPNEGIGRPGWSGSINVVLSDGQFEAIAVANYIRGSPPYGYGNYQGSLSLSSQAAFLYDRFYPVPEPAACSLLVIGLGALGLRRLLGRCK